MEGSLRRTGKKAIDRTIIWMDNLCVIHPMLDTWLKLNWSGHFRNIPQHFMRRSSPMDYLLIWVISGYGFAEVDGRRVEAGPGHLLSFVPGRPQAYGADPERPWEIVWVHFQGRLAREFSKRIRRHGPLRIGLGLDPELHDRWLGLVIAHAARGPGVATRVNTELYALLGLICHRLESRSTRSRGETTFDVHRLQSFIHNHLAGRITLAELAREARLSPTHFARVFKRCFGISPIALVIQKRVGTACALLTETAMPLKQVGAAVGCEDPYYFSRVFKKVMGVSPLAYRRSARDG